VRDSSKGVDNAEHEKGAYSDPLETQLLPLSACLSVPPNAFRSPTEHALITHLVSAGVDGFYRPFSLSPGSYPAPSVLLRNGVLLDAVESFHNGTSLRRVLKAHIGLDVRLVFSNASRALEEHSPTTCKRYCERFRIPWAQWPNLPVSWLKERSTGRRWTALIEAQWCSRPGSEPFRHLFLQPTRSHFND
jgi:hypothetical protein